MAASGQQSSTAPGSPGQMVAACQPARTFMLRPGKLTLVELADEVPARAQG